MKAKELSKKLTLNKITVANLNHAEMKKLRAGDDTGEPPLYQSKMHSDCLTCTNFDDPTVGPFGQTE